MVRHGSLNGIKFEQVNSYGEDGVEIIIYGDCEEQWGVCQNCKGTTDPDDEYCPDCNKRITNRRFG